MCGRLSNRRPPTLHWSFSIQAAMLDLIAARWFTIPPAGKLLRAIGVSFDPIAVRIGYECRIIVVAIVLTDSRLAVITPTGRYRCPVERINAGSASCVETKM